MKEQPFSNIAPTGGKQLLAINKTDTKALTKNQQEFNKLTQRIAKLQKELDRKSAQLDEAVKLYTTEYRPLQKEMALHQRLLLDVLWQVYSGNPFAKAEQKYLREIIREQLQEVLYTTEGEPDAELKTIFEALAGERYEAAAKREEDERKQQMQDMFDDMDIDIDLSGIDAEDQASLAEKMAEAQQKMKEREDGEKNRQQRRQREKKKTPKQLEQERLREQANEMKQKNISIIYKQLAKLFHPDLEQDEMRRAEKEILMKELTAAYEAKDLHTLLTLEMKWIYKENDHLETLTEEKLAIYLQILREQAQQLEHEKYGMIQQPRYSFLVQLFGPQTFTHPLKQVQNAHKQTLKDIGHAKRNLEDFKSPYGLRHIKAMIKEWKQARSYNDSEEAALLQMLYGRL